MNDHVIGSGDPRRYCTQIPDIVDDMHLSPYAFRLYFRIRREVDTHGVCRKSTTDLAASCGISTGMVTKAKRELIKAGLITVVENGPDRCGRKRHEILITRRGEA